MSRSVIPPGQAEPGLPALGCLYPAACTPLPVPGILEPRVCSFIFKMDNVPGRRGWEMRGWQSPHRQTALGAAPGAAGSCGVWGFRKYPWASQAGRRVVGCLMPVPRSTALNPGFKVHPGTQSPAPHPWPTGVPPSAGQRHHPCGLGTWVLFGGKLGFRMGVAGGRGGDGVDHSGAPRALLPPSLCLGSAPAPQQPGSPALPRALRQLPGAVTSTRSPQDPLSVRRCPPAPTKPQQAMEGDLTLQLRIFDLNCW